MTQPVNLFPITAPDIAAEPDADSLFTETTSEEQNLSQDLLHMLVTLPDTNLDAPGRGVGIQNWLNGSINNFSQLPAAIEDDFQKDARVLGCQATLIQNPTGSQFPYTIQTLISTVSGVFGLAFGWDSQGRVQIIPNGPGN